MSNPYFTNTSDLIAGSRARATDVESNFSAVEAGFDQVAKDFSQHVRTNASYITTNTQAVSGGLYVMGASLTLILPPTPSVNDWIGFANRSGVTTCVIDCNGSNLMGLAQNMNLDDANAFGCLVYMDATRGWVFF